MVELARYRNPVFDSARWEGFAFRDGDIVIDTPPKCGTTWMQTLCAMVVLGTNHFDRPLAEISPWLDMQTTSLADVVASLEAQTHRRFIKSHTPLDGLPDADGVTFLCVGRDPRDVALSFQHHLSNLDIEAFMTARAEAVGLDDLAALGPPPDEPPRDPREYFLAWMDADASRFAGGGMVDVLHHLATFWERRDRPDVALFHYGDLLRDLPGQVRRLADVLSIPVDDADVDRITAGATFATMKARADDLVPDVGHRIWRSNVDFFHRGASDQWRDVLDDATVAEYLRRAGELVGPELVEWAHEGWLGAGAGDRAEAPPARPAP